MSETTGKNILLVTGLTGAGKSTVLRTLEDLGWETVDNLPLLLLDRLLETAAPIGAGGDEQPLAIGFSSRTRGFDAERIVRRIKRMAEQHQRQIGTLFLDCSGAELERRYSETRRRHPLALDRPASDGIAQDRELLMPLRRWANRLIDTSHLSANQLSALIRATFGDEQSGPTLSVMSFGFARGVPTTADLVFDMRFLRNPHWVPELRPGTGLDRDVADYVRGDTAYDAIDRIEQLIVDLIPRYRAEGKSYLTVALGCTGGRHRSVHVAERIAQRLRDEGFSPTVQHRDLGTAPQDALEPTPLRKMERAGNTLA